MKIIFLDMDGVLNSNRWLEDRRKELFDRMQKTGEHPWRHVIDRRAVSRLNQIIEATSAKVVISSAWRHHHSWKKMQEYLDYHGFVGEVIGQTPAKMSLYDRWAEIHMWFSDAETQPAHIVILDDIHDMGKFRRFHVWIDEEAGLQDEHVQQAIDILNKPFERIGP